jgi:hypothetical protein
MRRLGPRTVGLALALTVVLIGALAVKGAGSPATQQGTITNLHMSDSCDGTDMTLFPNGTQTVYVVFDYSDMRGEEWQIVVTGPDSVALYDEPHSYTGSDTECITVTHTSGPIPPGNYVTTIKAGDYPIKTLRWYVRPGGPGEITNLRMSTSPDGPSETEFIEGTLTVWVIFDYTGMEGNEVWIKILGWYDDLVSPSVILNGSGTQATSITHPWTTIGGFPVEQYTTHVLKDGFVDGIVNWSVVTEGATSTPTATPTTIPATATATSVPSTPTPTAVPATATATPMPPTPTTGPTSPYPAQPTPTPTSALPTPTLEPGQPTLTPVPPTPTLAPEQPYPTPMPPTATLATEQPTPTPMPPTLTPTPTPPTPTPAPPTGTATEVSPTPTLATALPTATPMPATAEVIGSEPSTPSPSPTTALPTPTTTLTPMFTAMPTATSGTTEGTRPFLVIAGYAFVAVVLGFLALLLWQKRSS